MFLSYWRLSKLYEEGTMSHKAGHVNKSFKQQQCDRGKGGRGEAQENVYPIQITMDGCTSALSISRRY